MKVHCFSEGGRDAEGGGWGPGASVRERGDAARGAEGEAEPEAPRISSKSGMIVHSSCPRERKLGFGQMSDAFR